MLFFVLGASHRVAAIEAAVTGAVSHADAAADITGRRIVLKMLKLVVELAHNAGLCSIGAAGSSGNGLYNAVGKPVRIRQQRFGLCGRA